MEDGTLFASVAIGVAAIVAAFVQRRARRQTARTGPFSAPVWAAAHALAKSRGHAELREEHLCFALLFDASIERRLATDRVNVSALRAELDAHLATLATYRTNEAANVDVAPSLAARVNGVRDDVDALLDVLLEKPTAAIERALAVGRATKREELDSAPSNVVLLKVMDGADRGALVATLERHFALSRAAATFVVESAASDGHATVGVYPPEESMVLVEAAKMELGDGASIELRSDAESPKSVTADAHVTIDKSVELALTLAATMAKESGHGEVTTSHLLRVLVRRDHIADAFAAAGADIDAIEAVLEKDLATVRTLEGADMPLATDGIQRVLRNAVTTAQSAGFVVDEASVIRSMYREGDMGTLRALQASKRTRSELLGALFNRKKTARPKAGEKQIVLYDDDVTTMEQVVSLLTEVFGFDFDSAREQMFEVHLLGESVIATRPAAEADELVERAHAFVRKMGAPLRVAVR